ncbi:class F sortase [Arthrobacter sp. KK5.5]|uniref:class F sortase n=1 Tax=Arthrobacter sp. KK5.5 TaxID=3373084 RepID=UPI003EE783AF
MKHAKKPAGLGTRSAVVASLLAGLVGTVLVGMGVRGEDAPPSPPSSEAVADAKPSTAPNPDAASAPQASPESPTPSPTIEDPTTADAEPAQRALLMEASQPTRLQIPAIGVDTNLMNVGLQDDGTIGVPPLLADSPAGWYDRGPTPGEQGPAVILGHVTALNQAGPAIFFKLGALRQGDEISVTRADNTVAVFTVNRLVQTPKPDFSSMETYGNTEDAQLRLITCGGEFDNRTGRHADNIVVYAELTSSHSA